MEILRQILLGFFGGVCGFIIVLGITELIWHINKEKKERENILKEIDDMLKEKDIIGLQEDLENIYNKKIK